MHHLRTHTTSSIEVKKGRKYVVWKRIKTEGDGESVLLFWWICGVS
jgi:hypothetical protein